MALAALWAGLFVSLPAMAADLPSPAPPIFVQSGSFNPSGFELRGGVLASTAGPETGEVNLNAELVLPRFYTLPGWQNYLIPRLHAGVVGNLQGGTDYAYVGGLWRVLEYHRIFGEIFLGGAVHDGQVNGHDFDPNRNKLGCRFAYHVGSNVGYQIDERWSIMATFDHISNGAGTLSDCKRNEGATVLGLRIGYGF